MSLLQVSEVTVTYPTALTTVNTEDTVFVTWLYDTLLGTLIGSLLTEQVYEIGFDDPENPDQFVGLNYPVTTGSILLTAINCPITIPSNVKSSDKYYALIEVKNLSPLAVAPRSVYARSDNFTIINPADPVIGDPGFTDGKPFGT